MAETIGGTVIQRSFVGRDIPNAIHVATVPVDELGASNTELEVILSEILAIPRRSVLSGDDYNNLIILARTYPPHFFTPAGVSGRAVPQRLYERLFEAPAHHFLGDFVSWISSPLFGLGTTFAAVMLEERLFPIQDGRPPSLEKGEDAQLIALSCLYSRLAYRPEVEAFYKEMLSYDIPIGQSPQTKRDSLLTLLETSRKFCVAPLALGATPAISQLSQGNYVGALLTTGTASVMTLVLIGTVSVGSLIVQRVAQVRSQQAAQVAPSATTPRH